MLGSFVLTFGALAILFLITRVQGDESIGFGAVFLVNDGAGDAYVSVPKIVTLGIPNETTGTTESKTLDLPQAVIRKIATLKNGGSFTVKYTLLAATFARFEVFRKARATKKFKVQVPTDEGTLEIIVPGICTSNKIEDIEAENISMVTATIEVSGPQEA